MGSMRTINFRAWCDNKMLEWKDLLDNKLFIFNNASGLWIFMQFTGLKDKNGKEIYEKSDVLSCGPSKDGFVYKDTVEFGWSKDDEYGIIWSTSKNIVRKQDFINERYEVIGNIYENPELLK